MLRHQSRHGCRRNSTKPVDPSNLLYALKLSIIRGVPLDFNIQQNVVKILQVVLDELKRISIAAGHLIRNTQKIWVSYNTCFFSSIREKSWYSNGTSISWHPNFYEPVSKANLWFCHSCNVLCESIRETCSMNSVPILTIQLSWFFSKDVQLVKDENSFSCTQTEPNKDLMVPITIEDEVSFTNKYSLIATINYSGASNMGHYWALSRIYSPLLGTFGMASQILTLKKIMLTILHHTSFFTAKFKFFLGSTKYFYGFARGFVISDISDISLGVTTRHITQDPSPTWKLGLLPQFSDITTLEFLVSETPYSGAWPGMVLCVRSDEHTYRPSPSTSFCFRKAMERGLTKHGLVYDEWGPHT